MIRRLLQISIVSFLLYGCDMPTGGNSDGDVVAEAFGHKLYQKEVDAYMANLATAQDSQFIRSKIVDDWIMDRIIYEEANTKIKDKSKINKLVQGYRQSLIISEWEQDYIDASLDTFISQTEIDSFFNFHKEDFLLEEPIMRFLYVKLPSASVNDTFNDLWKTEDIPALIQYASQHNGLALLDIREWHKQSALKNIVPVALFAKVSLKKPNNYTLKENDTEFYLRIIEIINDKEDVPVEFVKERIKLRILQDRIKSLIKKKKSSLFEEKIKSKEIKFYGKAE